MIQVKDAVEIHQRQYRLNFGPFPFGELNKKVRIGVIAPISSSLNSPLASTAAPINQIYTGICTERQDFFHQLSRNSNGLTETDIIS